MITAKDLVQPIRSVTRYEPSGRESDPLEVILAPWDGSIRRFPANIIVYGGEAESAVDFARLVESRREAEDTLWRVGSGYGPGLWIPSNDRLLNIIKGRLLFVPGESEYAPIVENWRGRADYTFIGRGLAQHSLVKDEPNRRSAWPRPLVILRRVTPRLGVSEFVGAEFAGAEFAAAPPASAGDELANRQVDREWYFNSLEENYDLHVRGSAHPLGEYRFEAATRKPELANADMRFALLGATSNEAKMHFVIALDYRTDEGRWEGNHQIRLRELPEDCNLVCEGPAR